MYFPSHAALSPTQFTEWKHSGQTIGYCRQVAKPEAVWLMMHGNAGQAANREYMLDCMSDRDALYVLEYPGYGSRAGSPSKAAFDRAASEAYRALRLEYPTSPICVVGESLGSGPASMLAQEPQPPDKIVLITPFDTLYNVAARRFFFLPVWLLLTDRWDNVQALTGYQGPLEIYGAREDTVIPIHHAQRLAEQHPSAQFIEVPSGHNDWAFTGQVVLEK